MNHSSLSSPTNLPGVTAQHDPDVCPRCGARRSYILQEIMAGKIIPVNCDECWKALVDHIHKYQEIKGK